MPKTPQQNYGRNQRNRIIRELKKSELLENRKSNWKIGIIEISMILDNNETNRQTDTIYKRSLLQSVIRHIPSINCSKKISPNELRGKVDNLNIAS